MKLLYLQASPRLARSHSLAMADPFIEAWRKYNPDGSVLTHNVFTEKLPAFDAEAVEAHYQARAGLECAPEQRGAWGQVEKLAREFESFDRYVIAAPMWNHSLPYRLKHYLDLVLQPGISLGSAAAVEKKVCFFLARGEGYPEGSPLDFQRPYLEQIFKAMGLPASGLHWVLIEPTDASPEDVKAMHTARIAEALTIAKEF